MSDQDPGRTRIAVFTAGFPPAKFFGGPVRTLSALIEQQPEDYKSLTITSDRDHDLSTRLPVPSNQQIDHGTRSTYYVSTDSMRALFRAYRAVRQFRPDALYLNSFFNWKFSILPQIAHLLGMFGAARLVIAPRGEFSRGALAIRSGKKERFVRLYALSRLDRRVIWHASTVEERDDIVRIFDPTDSILVRENDTRLPLLAQDPVTQPGERLSLVFLSRISEKKGLHTLLEALLHTRESVALSIFGFAEDPRYLAQCEEMLKLLPAHVSCTFRGPVDADVARDAFAGFDLFAFPTAGENFGHAIAESLSVSCPIMCSDTTPWTRLIQAHGAGVVIDSLDPGEWARAIDDYATLSPGERASRRHAAGKAYEAWRSDDKGPHLFELLSRGVLPSGARKPSA